MVVERALEAFAVGDAMGMPTEFMTLNMICQQFGIIDTLIDPSISLIHKNLNKGQITDDTEQVLYLLDTFYKERKVTIEGTVEGLRRWIGETNADKKGYIGPSSLKALQLIHEGEKAENAGLGGTTCGAAMRALTPVLSVENGNKEMLKEAIYACSVPTHNTNIALEASMSIGFGYQSALMGASFDEIIESILEGAEIGKKMSNNEYVGASTGERIRFALDKLHNLKSIEEVLSFIYNVIGTNMESNEVVPAAVTIFAYAKEDTWLSVRMGASVGGDTDTIAAISGALSCLYGKGHNIPNEIVNEVLRINNLNLKRYANLAQEMLGGKK